MTTSNLKMNLYISKNGAVWSSGRPPVTLDTMVAEVERMIAFDKESIAKYGRKAHALWVVGWYQGFDDNGLSAVVSRPATVEIEQDSTVHHKGPVLARWVGGERVL